MLPRGKNIDNCSCGKASFLTNFRQEGDSMTYINVTSRAHSHKNYFRNLRSLRTKSHNFVFIIWSEKNGLHLTNNFLAQY